MSDAKKFLEGQLSIDEFINEQSRMSEPKLHTIAKEVEEHIARNVSELGLASEAQIVGEGRAEIGVDTVDAREMTVVIEHRPRSGTFLIFLEENGQKAGKSEVLDVEASMEKVKDVTDRAVSNAF